MGQKTIDMVLAAAVANSGTITGIAYPAGTNQAFFTGANAQATGVAIVNGNDVYREAASKVSITYGASTITVTNSSSVTWPAGADLLLQFGYATPAAATVIQQPAIADFAALTDSPATADALRDDITTKMVGKLNTLLEELRAAGVIATS